MGSVGKMLKLFVDSRTVWIYGLELSLIPPCKFIYLEQYTKNSQQAV